MGDLATLRRTSAPGRMRLAGNFCIRRRMKKKSSSTSRFPSITLLIALEGNVSGLLDSTPYEYARFLAAGDHRVRITSPARRLAVGWAQAVERKFHLSLGTMNQHLSSC
jgi:hypothetical protein